MVGFLFCFLLVWWLDEHPTAAALLALGAVVLVLWVTR
jgi:hypothetical protein